MIDVNIIFKILNRSKYYLPTKKKVSLCILNKQNIKIQNPLSSKNLFQFGSKKIKIKLENLELKIELDKKYNKLEDFININKNTEEKLQKVKKPFLKSINLK